MMPTLRAATLTHFEEVALACGLNPRVLVAESGLPIRCLREPDLTVPAYQVGALLELAAQRAGEPAFGLRMAASRRLSNLGALGLLLRDQPTLGRALAELIAHIHMHAEVFSLNLVETQDWVSIREEIVLPGGQVATQATEMAMGTTFRILRVFLGESWQPRHVGFRHAAPLNLTWHRKVFGNAVLFGQDCNDILCSARDLEASNPGADPVMAKYSQQLLEADHGLNISMVDRVRRLVVLLLPRGHCNADVVAEHLGVTRRTVANHLASEGASFKIVVDDMRVDLLTRFLSEGHQSLTEIAALLGFSELSAFSRWHRTKFGMPCRKRQAL